MNIMIAAACGAVLGLVGTIGGVSAYQGTPHGVSQSNLYSYADN